MSLSGPRTALHPSSRFSLGLALALAPALAACQEQAKPTATLVVASAAPSAAATQPLDRLAPDELAPSDTSAYGFRVPHGMRIESRLRDRTYVVGRVAPEALANYVRSQVSVSHVEIAAERTIFPRAAIKGGVPGRTYDLEIEGDGPNTRLTIKDVTPPPPPPAGLSEEARWRAAGLTPQGQPLDPKSLE